MGKRFTKKVSLELRVKEWRGDGWGSKREVKSSRPLLPRSLQRTWTRYHHIFLTYKRHTMYESANDNNGNWLIYFIQFISQLISACYLQFLSWRRKQTQGTNHSSVGRLLSPKTKNRDHISKHHLRSGRWNVARSVSLDACFLLGLLLASERRIIIVLINLAVAAFKRTLVILRPFITRLRGIGGRFKNTRRQKRLRLPRTWKPVWRHGS